MEEKSKRKRIIKDLIYNNNNDVIETSEKATRASLEFPFIYSIWFICNAISRDTNIVRCTYMF